MMVGDQEIRSMAGRAAEASGNICLEMRDVTADDDEGFPAVNGVTLAVRAGEIVGIAGVSGNGQSELVQVLGGQRDATAGEMRVHGEPYPRAAPRCCATRCRCCRRSRCATPACRA